MAEYHIVVDYPHSPTQVWRALTDPDLVPLWTSQGLGGRPEGLATAVGTHFKFIAKPTVGFRGFVECEVLESKEPSLFRYSWVGDEDGEATEVTYRLEPHEKGTRFTFDHTGFRGVGGFFVAKVLERVRRKMLGVGLAAVLKDLDEDGRLRPSSTLRALS